MENLRSPGTYSLLMQLAYASTIQVGRLGLLQFPAGFYLYVGSALGGLHARLARHLRAAKRHHWHVDYLLDSAVIEEVWVATGSERLECCWAATMASAESVSRLHSGFGATDCRCGGHLFYAPTRPSVGLLASSRPGDSIRVIRPPLPQPTERKP